MQPIVFPQQAPTQPLAQGRILLAPMEGLLDCVLRDILTRVGGVDHCVSEFIRVTNTLLPKRSFIRVMPELLNGGKTPAGVPVVGQLLGSDPNCLAENAAQLAQLGPAGIDLNFGCPAKVVNRHGGGAMLLDDPELIRKIVSAVRQAVPLSVPVSAKMRLGFNDDTRAEACALAIAEAGASSIVIHARTKVDGYKPPAYWERIADVKQVVKIPITANGEIWTVEDAHRCREISGCQDIMIGRGIVANPGLAWAIRASGAAAPVSWQALLPLIYAFWQLVSLRVEARHRAGRLKQWLNALRRTYPQAEQLFSTLRCVSNVDQIQLALTTENVDIDDQERQSTHPAASLITA